LVAYPAAAPVAGLLKTLGEPSIDFLGSTPVPESTGVFKVRT
jgi:hypothetical protein